MLIEKIIDRFEVQSGQSADYLRDVARHSLPAFLKFTLLMPMANHRAAAPKDAWHAARLVATRREDCGPCVQIVVDMALADGVSPEVLRAVLGGRYDEVPEDVRAACGLAEAVASGAPEAEALSAEVAAKLGRKALVDLAMAISSARVFPALKRTLGYARSCSLVEIEVPAGKATGGSPAQAAA